MLFGTARDLSSNVASRLLAGSSRGCSRFVVMSSGVRGISVPELVP
jgi:hypothetical protein